MNVKKAVIPAAGFGTRFLPASKAIPKEMLPIVDKPTIQYNIEELIKSGIEDILIINSRNKDSIINHFIKKAIKYMKILEIKNNSGYYRLPDGNDSFKINNIDREDI